MTDIDRLIEDAKKEMNAEWELWDKDPLGWVTCGTSVELFLAEKMREAYFKGALDELRERQQLERDADKGHVHTSLCDH